MRGRTHKIQSHFGFWFLVGGAAFRLPEHKSETRFEGTTFMRLPPQPKMSSYDPVRPRQHIRRYREADLLGGFQVDQ